MEDSFPIEVTYKGNEYIFEARLAATGYTHKFLVLINDIEVTYEPDEERNYRAILNHPNLNTMKDADKDLIKLVGEKIESIIKQL